MWFQAYTSLFLENEKGELLVIKRSGDKKFAPNKYTGVGGKVDDGELGDIVGSLRREWEEETRIDWNVIGDVRLRGSIYVVNRDDGVGRGDETEMSDHLMYFFLGTVNSEEVTDLWCDEGSLHWVAKDNLGKLDWVHTIGRCWQYVVDEEVGRFTSVIDERDGEMVVKITDK